MKMQHTKIYDIDKSVLKGMFVTFNDCNRKEGKSQNSKFPC